MHFLQLSLCECANVIKVQTPKSVYHLLTTEADLEQGSRLSSDQRGKWEEGALFIQQHVFKIETPREKKVIYDQPFLKYFIKK